MYTKHTCLDPYVKVYVLRPLDGLAAAMRGASRVRFPVAVVSNRVDSQRFRNPETEVHPISLIEALAASSPAVGTVSPGVTDTVEDCVNGLLSAHNVTAFSRVLRGVMADAELRDRLAAGTRRTSLRHSIEHSAGQTVKLYQSSLENRTRREACL